MPALARAACDPNQEGGACTVNGCPGTYTCVGTSMKCLGEAAGSVACTISSGPDQGCSGVSSCGGPCELTSTSRKSGCTQCSGGGSQACFGGGVFGPCQPAAASTEVCLNSCDDNRDGQVDEGCGAARRYDYCDASGVRWQCGCGDDSVGYCLGAGDATTSCSNPEGCLKAPGFATGANPSQAGGYFQCCVSNLSCDDTTPRREQYLTESFQCDPALDYRFECRVGQACTDANQCSASCQGVSPIISSSDGATSREGAYCRPDQGGDCGLAQGGLGESGTVSAMANKLKVGNRDCTEETRSRDVEGAIEFYTVWNCTTANPSPDPGGDGAGDGQGGDGMGPGRGGSGNPANVNQCVGGPNKGGDPVTLGNYGTQHGEVDFGLKSSVGSLAFIRQYVSSEKTWAYQSLLGTPTGAYVPKPFGSSPLSQSSLRWWHTLYSFVYPKGWARDVSTWAVRDVNGRVHEFEACAEKGEVRPCVAQPRSHSATALERLYWGGGGTGGDYFILYSPKVRYVYEARWSASGAPKEDRYFLSRIEDADSPEASGAVRTLLTLDYAAPSGLSCPGASAQGNGVPYLASAATVDGARFTFAYAALTTGTGGTVSQECVLRSVGLAAPSAPAGSAGQTMVQFTYATSGGAERPGLLARTSYPSNGRYVDYTYPSATSNEFTVSVDGKKVSGHTYDASGKVVADWTPTQPLSTSSVREGNSFFVQKFIDSSDDAGDGTDTTVTTSRQYFADITDGAPYTLTSSYTDDCTQNGSGCMSHANGTVSFRWQRLASGQLVNTAVKNKRDAWTVYGYDAPAGASFAAMVAPSSVSAPRVLNAGAIDQLGTSPLASVEYDYVRPGARLSEAALERLRTKRRPSVLVPGEKVETTYLYDSTSQSKGMVVKGFTRTFDGHAWSAPVARYVARFQYTRHVCSEGAEDSMGRVLEVHGPCTPNNTSDPASATGCAAGETYPIIQYHYAPSTPGSNLSNRLVKVRTFVSGAGASGCSGAPYLETTYDDYDMFGRVLSTTDANGVRTTYTYEEDQVKTATVTTSVGSFTHTFFYEGGQLTAIRRPDEPGGAAGSSFEVFCYRSGTAAGAGCVGGTFTDRLQWRAKASDQAGADWSERITYGYKGIKQLLKERRYWTRDASGESLRRVERFNSTARGGVTVQYWGEGEGSYSATALTDSNGNYIGLAHPSNAAPTLCGGRAQDGTPVSKLCDALSYDRLDRLTALTEYSSDTLAQRTELGMDAHGNLNAVRPGCDPSTGRSDALSLKYQYDDFGNLLEAALPHAFDVTRFAYDLKGNPIVRETATTRNQSEYVSYVYDELSRLREAWFHFTGANAYSQRQYRLGYDREYAGDPATPSCATGPQAMGRLLYKEDSFGITWYQYDGRGLLTREIRARAGTPPCAGSLSNNPDTFYTYNADGNLTSITYPHGRKVTYVYGQGARRGRVVGVNYASYDGATWTERPLLSEVLWEPYGGLRGYRQHHTGGLLSQVEYTLGDVGTLAPASAADAATTCSLVRQLPSAGDATGRLRSLRVTSGTHAPGAGAGDLFTRTYTWNADQVARTDTCVLAATDAQTQLFSYDRTLRLTGASRPAGNAALTGGAFSSLSYTYDRRGNRPRQVENGFTSTANMGSAPQVDYLYDLTSSSEKAVKLKLSYDSDGRAVRRAYRDVDGSLWPGLDFKYGPRTNAATESVFRTVSVKGATYTYYYDAWGRRRLKEFPLGGKNEFFYGVGGEMLADLGADTTSASPGYYVVDDYVWLAGRPVAVVRGKFSAAGVRLSDADATCSRFGEDGACGAYHIVTDLTRRPVLVLNGQRQVSGVADLEPFGRTNRVVQHAGTTHPYGTSLNQTLASFQQPAGPGLTKQLRAHLPSVNTESCGATLYDYVFLANSAGTALSANVGGYKVGDVWTQWVTVPSDGRVDVRFRSNGQDCDPDANGCASLNCSATPRYSGVGVEGYEYRTYQAGARYFWTPLGFPGQYYDAESDLFENWNRYYDPALGRYLQPEPLALSPGAALRGLMMGWSTPMYSYAGNNPLGFRDSSGFEIIPLDFPSYLAVEALRADPILGPSIAAMEASADRYYVSQKPATAEMIQQGGAFSYFMLDRAGLAYGVSYDMGAVNQREVEDCGSNSQGFTVEQVVAHELGHLWSASFLGLVPGNQIALSWENTQRLFEPRRTHGNIQCPCY